MKLDERTKETLLKVAYFYDHRKVGARGPLGFRKSTDLMTFFNCLELLLDKGIIKPDKTLFMDLGCGDGRLNILLSYVVKKSVGIELDEWTLQESGSLRKELDHALASEKLTIPPDNIFFFNGDATDETVHKKIARETGVPFEKFDVFYTYLIIHQECARLIASKAQRGSILMIYGLDKILPRYQGMQLMEDISPLQGILALYKKA